MPSNTGHVMNLSNSIIGVSLLAMPFCFKQCGITLAIVMLVLSSIISRLACYFLVKSSIMCRRRNFEFLAFYTFGPSGKLLVELGVIGFMMGTCVAFFVVMGDLGPAIISKIFNVNNNTTLRTSVLAGLGLLVVLPLGLLRNVESLAAISTVTIGYYFLFTLKIFFESLSLLASGDWLSHVRFWKPEGILQCIPIFAMALSCQTQLFEIFNSLSSPSIEKMNSVVHSALNLCTLVYASVGLLGYIAYCKGNFTGNIMLSFSPSLSSEMFKLGFVMSIAVSFPLVIFPCRASLFSLIFKRMPIHQELSQTSSHIPDSRFKCLTIVIVSVALITGLLIPSIELVLGFVGSTIGIAICVIFPSLSFLNLYNKNSNERVMAKMTLMLGVIIMMMGTFGNLFAAVEHKPVQLSPGKLGDMKNLFQVKVPLKVEANTELVKKPINRGAALMGPVTPEKLVPRKSLESQKSRMKIAENVRKEPPIPIAPFSISSDQEKRNEALSIKLKKEKKEPQIELAGSKESFPEPGLVENINKDAIEKEEREIMEVEKQKKTEDDRKQQELLKRLKEHQDEQKKLLREQEKILKEIKNRENGKKQKEKTKEYSFLLKKVNTIKPDEFKTNINKIQNVIDSLKDVNNILSNEIPQNLNGSSGKPKEDEAQKIGMQGVSVLSKLDQKESEMRSPLVSVPLPLVKLRSQSESKDSQRSVVEKDDVKSKQEVLGRDILVEKSLKREKRDVEKDNGECINSKSGTSFYSKDNEKTEKLTREKEFIKEKMSNGSPVLIKNSVHLSVDLSVERKSEITRVGNKKLISNLQNLPFINARDLKSFSATNS